MPERVTCYNNENPVAQICPLQGIKCVFFLCSGSLLWPACWEGFSQHVGWIKILLWFAAMAVSVVFVSEVFWQTPKDPPFPATGLKAMTVLCQDHQSISAQTWHLATTALKGKLCNTLNFLKSLSRNSVFQYCYRLLILIILVNLVSTIFYDFSAPEQWLGSR